MENRAVVVNRAYLDSWFCLSEADNVSRPDLGSWKRHWSI